MSHFKLLRKLRLPVRLFLVLALLLASLPANVGERLALGIRDAHAVPFLTAVKNDVLVVDNDGDAVVDPGDTIRYTVTITNSGTTNATSAVFSDTIDANTTLVPGSVKTTPIARNDSYAVLGNVAISVPAAAGLIQNPPQNSTTGDNDPDGGTVTVTSFDSFSVQGTLAGLATPNVSVAADGSFTYNPPPGYEGADTFDYTITDDEGSSDQARVGLVVSDMIWFVDASASCPCDGRLSNPFNDLAVTAGSFDLNAADDPGDNIFVADGSYSGGLTLLADQLLVGDGSSSDLATVTGITVPPYSAALPTFSGTDPVISSSANGINLGTNSTVRGLTVGNSPSGTGLAGAGVGTLTVSEVTINGTGGGLDINGGTLAVSLDSLTASSSTDEGIRLVNVGGSFSVPAGSINTTNVPAVDIDGNPSLALNVNLDSVSASGAANGILVRDTSGSFTVTGSGSTDGSGGTISTITNRGAGFINAQNISLDNMTFNNASTANAGSNCDSLVNSGCNAAIHLESSTGIDLTNVDIDTSAQQGINGLNLTNFTLADSTVTQCGDAVNEGCLRLVNLVGTASISNSDLSFAAERVAQIANTGVTLALTVSNSTFRDTQSSGLGADGLEITSNGASNTTIDIVDSSFLRNRTNGLQVFSEDTSFVSLDVTGSTFDRGAGIGIGMDLAADDSATLHFNVTGNPLINSRGSNAVNVFSDGSATVQGRINDNPDIQAGGSSTSGFGIRAQANTNSNMTLEIDNNTISNIGFDAGIQVISRLGGTGRLDATINNNNVTVDAINSLYDIWVQAQNSNTTCANVTNNTTSTASVAAFRARTVDVGSTVILQGAGVTAKAVWDNNGNTPTGSVSSSHNGTLTLGGTCNTVSHPTAMLAPDAHYAFSQPNSVSRTQSADMAPVSLDGLKVPLAEVLATMDAGSVLNTTGALVADLVSAFQATPAYASGEAIDINLGTLNPGQVVLITFDVTVDATIPANVTQVCNQGLLTGDNFVDLLTDDPSVGGATDPTCTSVPQADLRIEKTDSADPVAPGDPFSYTVTVFNDGPSAAQDVEVSDTLPAGVTFVSTSSCAEDPNGTPTCSLGSIPAAGSQSYTINVTAPPTGGTFTNNASVTSTTHDPDAGDNSASEDTDVVSPTDLKLTKSDGDIAAVPGSAIVYALNYDNAGGPVSGVVIKETVPANTTFNAGASTAGWSCADNSPGSTVCTLTIGALAPGDNGSVDFAVDVDNPLPAGVDQISNTATIEDDGTSGPDQNPGDNTAGETTPVDAAPDLQISKADDGPSGPGETINYTMVFTNAGPQGATGVSIGETVPANTTFNPGASTAGWACAPDNNAGSTCTLTLGALIGGGASSQVNFAVDVSASLPPGVDRIFNTVLIADDGSNGPDQSPGDNSSSIETIVNEPPEIVAISPQNQAVQYSDRIAPITIVATDSGTAALTISAASLPSSLAFVSTTGDCSPAAGGVECTWTLEGQVLEPAGGYQVEVAVNDGSLESDPATFTIEVVQEDTTVAFDPANPIAVEVASAGGNSGIFALLVDVVELDDPEDVAGDSNLAGDISLAQLAMTLDPVGPGSSVTGSCMSAGTTPGLADSESPYNHDILTVACTFDHVPVNTYRALARVGGSYYVGTGEGMVSVFDPSLGFATGGGWISWPDGGDKTDFSFNVRYDEKRQEFKGNLQVIGHLAGGSKVRLKASSLDSLAVGEEPTHAWASFTGEGTYQAPGRSKPEAGYRFLVHVEDRGQPGSGNDRFWIEILDPDGNLVEAVSIERPAMDRAVVLSGGNVKVHNKR